MEAAWRARGPEQVRGWRAVPAPPWLADPSLPFPRKEPDSPLCTTTPGWSSENPPIPPTDLVPLFSPRHRGQKEEAVPAGGDRRELGQASGTGSGVPVDTEEAAYPVRTPQSLRAGPGKVAAGAGAAGTGTRDSSLLRREEGLSLAFKAPPRGHEDFWAHRAIGFGLTGHGAGG